jgi:cob(I)alamin adenosyltransferase
MRLDKIYTKIGDGGTTLLANGDKVPKSSARIDTYGTVDELNSFLGLLIDELSSLDANPEISQLISYSKLVQNELFDLGGELATPAKSLKLDRQKVVGQTEIKRLESEIDHWTSCLDPLENFVLPGGLKANSLAHVCRTIARRAERKLTSLRESEEVRLECQIYLNRLSDWFFVAARFISMRYQVPEELWQQRR